METQIKSLIKTPKGLKLVTIFGYSCRGVPGLEINGVGKLSKNIKEKMTFITRYRRLSIPLKRFVISVDVNDLDEGLDYTHLKWLEFPCLLVFWHLAGFIPISSLRNCVSSGWLKVTGDVIHLHPENESLLEIKKQMNPIEYKSLKFISSKSLVETRMIQTNKLLEHIEDMRFH